MKKTVAILLALCLTVGLFYSSAVATSSELPRFRIALLYGEFTSKLGEQYANSLKYLEDAMNVEIVLIEGGWGEQTTAAIESAVATGNIDGIVSASGASPAFLAASKGTPFVAFASSFPSDPAELAEVCAYENFLGGVVDSDYNAGYSAAESMYNDGCRNLCVAGLTKGMSAAHDARIAGVMDFLAEHPDYKLLADNYSLAEYASAISAFSAAFPEMDSLFTTSCNDTVFTSMITENLIGYVKLGTVDIKESTGEYFENGTLSFIAGGQYASAMIAFAVLYNYLADGTRIISDTSVPMMRNYIVVHNSAEFEEYLKNVDGEVPVYTADEIKNLIHYYNADVGFDTFQELNAAYSMEDILARHGE